MSNHMKVRVAKTSNGWEATVVVPGLQPTKLVRKADGGSEFSCRDAVNQTAKNLAKFLGLEIESRNNDSSFV